MSIPFSEWTVLPTQLVLLDDLAGHIWSSIILKTAHTILHKPSLISNLLKWIGSPDSGAVANASMMRGINVPTCSSASDGAVYFVPSFTDDRYHPTTFNSKDRSKIDLYFLLLCSIIANGEMFKFDSGFYFKSSQLTMVANLCANFSCASTWICEIVSSSNADEWEPLVTASSI